MPISLLGHPVRTPDMTLPRQTRSRRFAIRVDMEDIASRLLPIDSRDFSIEKPDVRHKMLLIVRREHFRDGSSAAAASSGGANVAMQGSEPVGTTGWSVKGYDGGAGDWCTQNYIAICCKQ